MRVLALCTDAYGGRGGIAQYNRDLFAALAASKAVAGVVVLPRLMPDPVGPVQDRVTILAEAARGAQAYLTALARLLLRDRHFDVVLCGHVHLLPLGALAARVCRARLVLNVHGVEVWTPVQRSFVRRALRVLQEVLTVSAYTQQRFQAWARLGRARCTIIPNTVDLNRFSPGPKDAALARRIGVEGRKVILTLARLSPEERYKGIDEVMAVLARVATVVPEVVYVIAGSGDDRARLEALALAHGVADHVRFPGYVEEADKVALYRLADVFAMPGRGEGFGIVYLEALASGVPVVGSCLDASAETLLHGRLGQVVNPDDPDELYNALVTALEHPEADRALLEATYSPASFAARVDTWARQVATA
jgi:phosphatidyl-myo-inositol dimannoside synthase